MKRIVILFFLSCLNFSFSHSLNFTFSPQDVKHEVSETAARLQTMQCDFVQTKELKMLNDKMVSKGVMYYQKGNKLHWEYKSPYTYTFILNDSKVALRNNKRNDVIDVNQNKVFREIVKIMMNSVVGKCLSNDKDFNVSIHVTPAEYQATMVPLRKDLKQMFKTIVLHFDRQQKMVTQVELLEKTGDKTLIKLSNIKTNVPIAASVFAIH